MSVALSKQETLFSFDFLVEYVRVDTHCKFLTGWKPAVGVRLLDFPTLVIYQSDQKHGHGSESDKSQTNETFSKSEVDRSCEVIFHKGKSCLFKINLDFLQKHLTNAPLYTMVMDVGQEAPKLIGSSLISLARLVNQIKSDVEAHGIGTPSSYSERGTHDLCNLMGMKIGLISIACKLVSFGGSLIPHIPENKIHSVGTTLSQGSNGTETANMTTEVVFSNKAGTIGVEALEQEDSSHVICQSVKFDGQPKNIVVSEAEQKRLASTSTQTEQTKNRIKKIQMARIDFEGEPNPTLFCPPPMFYYSSCSRQEDKDKESNTATAGMDSLMVVDTGTDEELSDSEMPISKEQRVAAIPELPTGSQIEPQPLAPSHLGDAIRQLPLVNALLVELSLLNGQNQQQTLSIHPSLAWIYTSAQGPSDPAADSTKPASQTLKNDASPLQEAQQSSSPRWRHSEHHVKSPLSISSPSKPRKTKENKHSPHPEKTKPKKKLTYGLTHTYQLRLNRLCTDLPKPRECREHVNTKQLKPAKQNDKSLSSSCMLKRNLNLDDNIPTLICSTDVDSTQQTGPPKSKESSNICHLCSGCGDSLNHEASIKHTSKKKPVHFKQDKELHIRIPSAMSQHSGHSDLENRANNSVFSSINEDEGGQDESRWSSPPSKFSDSSSENIDQDYQDDFTSLDPTDGYSPDPLSSPEPRMTRVPSDPSSLKDESKNPGLPVPVKAATSPKRSLKGTHLIRQSMRASGLSVSSDGGDLRSGYTPSADSRHSQTKSESQDSELGGRASLSKNPTRSRSDRSNPSDDVTCYRGYSEDSFAHHSDSDPESLSLPDPIEAEEENDQLRTLGLSKKYQHISDLTVNKLPGYTL